METKSVNGSVFEFYTKTVMYKGVMAAVIPFKFYKPELKISKNFYSELNQVFLTTHLFWDKNNSRNNENQLVDISQFWQQEEGQLGSTDVVYQMVGLCE